MEERREGRTERGREGGIRYTMEGERKFGGLLGKKGKRKRR